MLKESLNDQRGSAQTGATSTFYFNHPQLNHCVGNNKRRFLKRGAGRVLASSFPMGMGFTAQGTQD